MYEEESDNGIFTAFKILGFFVIVIVVILTGLMEIKPDGVSSDFYAKQEAVYQYMNNNKQKYADCSSNLNGILKDKADLVLFGIGVHENFNNRQAIYQELSAKYYVKVHEVCDPVIIKYEANYDQMLAYKLDVMKSEQSLLDKLLKHRVVLPDNKYQGLEEARLLAITSYVIDPASINLN